MTRMSRWFTFLSMSLIFLFFFCSFSVFSTASCLLAGEKESGKKKPNGNTKNDSKNAGVKRHFRITKNRMETLYKEGKLEQVIDLYVKNCRVVGKKKEKKAFKKVNKETRALVYQLVFQAYTALDKPEEADVILRKFLAIRHREGVDGAAWTFIKNTAREKYYVAPRFLVGLKLGTNFTLIDPGSRYTVLEPIDPGKMKDYRKKYDFHLNHSRGTHFGVILEYALTKNLSITLQPALSTLKFNYNNQFDRSSKVVEGDDEETKTLNYIHRHRLSYIQLPVLLKYRWIMGKLNPYVQVGGYIGLLTSAEKSLYAFNLPNKDEYSEEAIIGIDQQISSSSIGFWFGAGLGYQLKSGLRLRVEANYRHGLNNIVDTGLRFANKELIFAYYDVFDDMKIRNLELSVKILLPISYKAFRK